jgi:ubiquinone/menaquinone biosynthesis C-methylase UbiE
MEKEQIPQVFSSSSALSYEAFYRTDYGQTIDRLEKALMEKLIREVIPISWPAGAKLLEVGCGTGVWTAFFTQLGFTVVAIDPSEGMLEVAKSKGITGVTFLKGMAEDLPFSEGHFDAVAAITVLEFVEDLSQTLEEIHRVLKPGGWFFGGFLNRDSELGKRQTEDPIIRHGSLFTKQDIESLLALFERVVIEGCVHLSDRGEVKDGTSEKTRFPPAFFGVRANKPRSSSR